MATMMYHCTTIFFHLMIFLVAKNNNSNSSSYSVNDPTSSSRRQQCKATNNSNSSNNGPRNKYSSNNTGRRGRQRYSPASSSSSSSSPSRNKRNKRINKNNKDDRHTYSTEDDLPVIPALTISSGPFPTLFTCRHTYEDELVEELTDHYYNTDSCNDDGPIIIPDISSPYPGLVYVEEKINKDEKNDDDNADMLIHNNKFIDPVYALQVLPNCHIVQYSNSIKGLAKEIATVPSFHDKLLHVSSTMKSSSLSVHAIVPGMCKGQKNPILQRRCTLIGESVIELWKKQYSVARKRKSAFTITYIDDDNNNNNNRHHQHLLLQILLLSPDVAAASLCRCYDKSDNNSSSNLGWWWPNPKYPVGMAKVDITTQKMPSSAYRKLLEAIACMGIQPSGNDTIVDLGASPGGWTSALLLYFDGNTNNKQQQQQPGTESRINRGSRQIHIVAVDRSSLVSKLMNDPRVTFIQGDAFTFEPDQQVTWMISDIIAYPERIVELLNHWCEKHLAINMIVTLKFQGSTPAWKELEEAKRVAAMHGYNIRAKHFFNNKNEVTLMLQDKTSLLVSAALPVTSSTIPPFYKLLVPGMSS